MSTIILRSTYADITCDTVTGDVLDVDYAAMQHDDARAPRCRSKRAKPVLPPVVKLLPPAPARNVRGRDETSRQIDALIAAGAYEVTRCLPGQSRNYMPKRGGVMPAHLDPVTLA